MFELTADQEHIQEAARQLAAAEIGPRAAEVDRTEDYPWDNVDKLKSAGFMGMTIPEEYGGLGLSYLDAVLVIEQMAKYCGVTARIVVEANMGAIGAIMKYGTEKQKQRAAALVLAGDKPAICITEPGAGSAATEMTTTAVKKGDRYVINGLKHWITGGGVSRLHLIFARVMEDGEHKGIGGFIAVREEDEGLVIGRREPAMGLRGIPETEIVFQDLEVLEDMAVIPPQGLKRGFAGPMNAYNGQRVGAATVALGIAAGAYELAVEYAKLREQFGRPIAEFQGLQWIIADMSVGLAAAQALVYKAAAGAGSGFPDIRAAAQAKVLASETAIKVTNDALQIHGAAGYSRNLPLERMVRDARMFTIGGGTAQILKTQIAGSVLEMKTPQTRDGHLKLAKARD
jgi:alkylation response protein AidB-like acyl-CoA dehydrogenase